MKDRPYKFISENCDHSMKIAFETFVHTLGEKRTRSRTMSLVTRMQKTIDPAWKEFVSSYIQDARLTHLFKDFLPGRFAKSNGFFELEDWCIQAIRNIRREASPSQIEKLPSLECALTKDSNPTSLNNDFYRDQLVGTIIELRSIALHCRLIRPKFRPVTKNNRSRNFNIQNCQLLCKICLAPTELMAFANDPTAWGGDEYNIRRPSKTYCREHRPIAGSSTSPNSTYQRYLRNSAKIELELNRLQRQSTSWTEPRADTGNPYTDEFFRLIASSNRLYPDEEKLMQKLAIKMVDGHINDIKKKIVVALKYGKTQAQIAQLLGVTQQAVSKSISKIPKEFRFDQPD